MDSDSASRSFTIAELSGSANAVSKKGKIEVSGIVANGANRAVVHVDGVPLGEQGGISQEADTSEFTITVPASVGDHDVEVYAHYDKHSKSIGSFKVTVHPPPKLDLPTTREFTNASRYVFTGVASAEEKIKETWYEWQEPDGTGPGYKGYVDYPEEKKVNLWQPIDMQADGINWFRFWVKAKDEQETWGPWTSIILDRQKPVLENRTVVKDGFILEDSALQVKVKDYDARGGKESSGVNSVMVQLTDKNNNKSAWLNMISQGGGRIREEKRTIEAEYRLSLRNLFKDLPAGDVKVEMWADDNAGNAEYLPVFTLKKAEAPNASVAVPKAFTNAADGKIDLAVKADAEVDIKEMWLDIWKADENGRSVKVGRTPIGSPKDKVVDLTHSFTFPEGEGKYLFHVLAKGEDGQQNDLSKKDPVSVIFDKTPATVALVSPKANSKLKSAPVIQFKVEDKQGSGIKDVQTQICQGDKCGAWIKDIQNDGLGVYTQTLAIDQFSSGEFIVQVWVEDKAGNKKWENLKFVKELNAAEALTPELSLKTADGSDTDKPFYFDTQRLLRIDISAKLKVTGATVAYSLPNGLALAGKAMLNAASANAPAAVAAQLAQWSGSGNLLADIDLEKDAVLVIDIPVTMSEKLPRTKVGVGDKITSFEITGKNFTGAARAETAWRADWMQDPADVNKPVSIAFDLSAPNDIPLFAQESGGYDTAEPAKWNRNTLHCGSGSAECVSSAYGTSIKLRFTEQATQKTVDLNLQGHRDQTLLRGSPTRSGALDAPANPGAEAGVDAEARFTITLPKSELARLPSGGQWRADLKMDLKNDAGARLAGFNSDIALDVSDKTDMSLKPPRIELLEGSHRDSNRSGGFSVNDEFIYRITYKAARDLNRVQLRLLLPPELTLTGERPRDAGSTANVALADGWNRDLLEGGTTMKRGQTVVIDVPLRVGPGAARLVSQVEASAEGFDPLPSAEAVLHVQRRFDASEALGLTLEMDRQDAGEEAVVAQQTPFKYRIVLASRKHAVDGLKLAYRLPGGMQAAGKPSLRNVPQLARVSLNAQWDGDANVELLAAGATLPREEGITIEIPVMIKDVVDDGVFVRSTVSAGAGNVNGELQQSHEVKIRERESGGHRVRIVKSMDGDVVAQPGAQIRYQIRVSNHTFKTVRNLLIRDRAPDHTTLVDASCGDLNAQACKTVTLGDEAVEDGAMTYAGLCAGAGTQSDPQGKHVFWCLSGDLEPLADYTVNYSVRIDGAAAPITP
ncbi:MAG TPA: CfaE/CblD family pilus tip adhesin [Herbaspirillum sp.]